MKKIVTPLPIRY